MEPEKIVTQVVNFQKTMFDNAYNAMTMVQDQTEKVANTFMAQFPWIPEEGKTAIAKSTELYKDSRERFKQAVDDGFTRLEGMYSR